MWLPLYIHRLYIVNIYIIKRCNGFKIISGYKCQNFEIRWYLVNILVWYRYMKLWCNFMFWWQVILKYTQTNICGRIALALSVHGTLIIVINVYNTSPWSRSSIDGKLQCLCTIYIFFIVVLSFCFTTETNFEVKQNCWNDAFILNSGFWISMLTYSIIFWLY